MKQKLEPLAAASHVLMALPSGILLTTGAEGRVNVMTISWGMTGIDWNTPIFITLVRTNRFSRTLLDKNPEFTINAPTGLYNRRIMGIAGTKSGWDMDKVAELGLHLVEAEQVSVPAIAELPLTLECRVIYRQPQEPGLIPPEIRNAYHPQDVASNVPGINRDFHIAYYGAIVAAYVLG